MNHFANKLVAVIVSLVLMIAGFMFSVVAFGVIAVLALIVGGWFWWKTRAIRRQMREQMADISRTMAQQSPATAGEDVIEGEFVRETRQTGKLPESEPPADPGQPKAP